MRTLTPAEWTNLAGWFDSCSELSAVEREHQLATLRRESPMLAERLAAMLAADASADGMLESSIDSMAPELLTSLRDRGCDLLPGQVLGRYRLLQAIGSGGMGEVWCAERADGEYRQVVAIKLLKRGMDTQAILRRFMQERSILARLNHPNIVRVIDGGSSEDGRPYYVMDHVEGLPLTRHAERAGLDVRACVRLVATITDAVAYAHSQLVVHRDLKPSNVIVDAAGTPHLLDFGIAKLLAETGEDTLTGTGARVLSPAYAAPEQILGEPVGTATDVYALGLVLFELLTGTLPHKRKSQDPAVLAGALAQESGIRASQALAVTGRDGGRRTESHAGQRRWAREIAGDLDVIIAKSLQSQPERRYATAAAFADDLRRWLDGEPIAARPDSAGYRLGRFVRRHRFGVAATVLVAGALVLGLGAAVWQAQRAEQQAARAELVKRFVLSLFDEQDPFARASAQARSPAQLIAAGLERAEIELADDPELRLEVVADLAGLQAGLGDAPAAVERLRATLAERQRDGSAPEALAAVQTRLAAALAGSGDLVAARAEAAQAVVTLEAAAAGNGLLAARARAQLARAMMSTGAGEPALEQIRASHDVLSRELGADHPETLEAQISIAVVLERIDRLDEAAEVFVEVIGRSEQVLGPDHARLVRPLTVLADIRRRQQRYDEARPLMERSVALARTVLGDQHPMLGQVLTRQGDLLRRIGDLDAAEVSLAEAQSILPPSSGEAAQVAMFQGGVERARKDHGAAAAAFERSHRLFLEALGPDSVFAWTAAQELANELIALDRLDEASDWLERALERQRSIAGPDSFDAATVETALGIVRRKQGRHEASASLLEHARSRYQALYGDAHPSTLRLYMELARTQREQGQLGAARVQLDTALSHRDASTVRPDLVVALLLESAELAQLEHDEPRRREEAGDALTIVQATNLETDALPRLHELVH